MIQPTRSKLLFYMALVLMLSLGITMQAVYATEKTGNLASEVASLELGMNGYTIGTKLSAEQKKISSTHLLNDAYEGTYKFSDGELNIVVAQQDDTVLALYQRNEGAGVDQTRKMISGLMGMYGEPTAMAHDKLIYWAYNGAGKIPEESYENSRKEGAKLEVLATVKFNSTFSIADENTAEQENGTIYFIISSDRLTAEFMENE